ncbi:early activation antigen CD69-like [Grus japonensis]|uniref:Early activation antigen CD69-like n=1 Tax=Grus japonensis TaxID=30415 RepID=A0ABC9XVW3_GRUJA
MLHGSKCYWVTDMIKSWSKSQDDCRNQGAELVMPGDQEELAFLNKILQKPKRYFWIGLSIPSAGKGWTWLNGSRLDQSREGNRICPNDEDVENPLGPQDEGASPHPEVPGHRGERTHRRALGRCCALPPAYGLVVAVVVAVILALAAALAVQSAGRREGHLAPVLACPDDWVGYRNVCYCLSTEEGSWAWSQERCSSHGASLAVLQREWEMEFLSRLKGKDDFWLGLRRQDERLEWVDGSSFTQTIGLSPAVPNCSLGQLSRKPPPRSGGVSDGTLAFSLPPAVGELRKPQKQGEGCKLCPTGWMLHGSKCYWVTDMIKSWSKSQDDCRNQGAELVMPGDQEELAFLNKILQKPKRYFWIGLSIPSAGKGWTWLNGSRLDQSRTGGVLRSLARPCLALRLPKSPSPYPRRKLTGGVLRSLARPCLALRLPESPSPYPRRKLTGGALRSLARPCLALRLPKSPSPYPRRKSSYGLVVAVLVAVILALAIALAVQSAGRREGHLAPVLACPDDWVGYRDVCYYLSTEEGSWAWSQERCSSHGASLAVLQREWEMEFLSRLKGKDDFWLGLRRQDERLEWVDGSSFTQTIPVLGQGACLYLNDNAVGSSSCSQQRPYICSKPQAQR